MNAKLFFLALGLIALPVVAQQARYTDAEAAKHTGEQATVTGKVEAVSVRGNTFMNFGGRFPNHVFTGIIFGRNADAVGDVKQYEGKEVSLTGRIELGPDKKPQIVINSADQIKLAGAAPAPAPVPASPAPSSTPMSTKPASAPAPAPSTPVPEGDRPVTAAKQIVLSSNWSAANRGGDLVRKDLAKIFGGCGAASEETRITTPIEVYPGLPFLCTLAFAKKALKLDAIASTRSKVITPGLPTGSFTSVQFSGVFPGGFDRLFIVTDNAEQVVSVLLVEQNTASRVPNEPDTNGYHMYNFISARSRATNDIQIKHEIDLENAPEGSVIVNTMLIDPNAPEPQQPVKPTSRSSGAKSSFSSKPKTGKVMERCRWYVPRPIVNLIMRCVTQ